MSFRAGHIPAKPHAFLASLSAATQADSRSQPSTLPCHRTFTAGEWSGSIAYAEREMLTASADGQRFVVLAGTIYRPQTANAGQTLLDLYTRYGADFVRDLHGSFVLMLVDQAAGEIVFATDRLNTLKLLASESNRTLTVSNAIDLQPVAGARVDSAALACYLAAGFIYNDRTIFEGVRVLDGGSLYRPRGLRLEQSRYWQYRPTDSTAASPTLRRDFEDALIDAVRVRLRGDHPYLALSAGYDSRAILGILTERLRVSDAHTFSYANGDASPSSDEGLARRLAALYGIEHRLIPSFRGSAVETLRVGGLLGGGMADVCDEIDAWLSFSDGASPRPLLFVGDTVLPHFDLRLSSVEDALLAARMVDFSALRWIEALAGHDWYARQVEATRAERSRALASAQAAIPGSSLYSLYDVLRLTHRDSRSIFTWRETIAAHFFDVASPFLDETVTDLTMNAPVAVRAGKRLFIEAVTAMFPRLFAVPLATSASYAAYWPDAIRTQRTELRRWIESDASPLDDLIEPRLLLALLDTDLSAHGRLPQAAYATLQHGYHLLQHVYPRPTLFSEPSLIRPVTSARQFIKRALSIRAFLQAHHS